MNLFDEPSRRPLPQPGFDDVSHAGRQALVSLIPVLGGPASELLGLLSSPVAQRRDDWLEDLARRLQELEGHVAGFHFEDLAQNERFVSATLVATQAALKTHDKAKLEALRNAVLNVAANCNVSSEQQGIFLSLVDSLQPVHMRLLHAVQQENWTILRDDGFEWLRTRVAGMQDFGRIQFKVFMDELGRLGLVNVTTDIGGLLASGGTWITGLGRDFIAFITAPTGTHGS